MANRSRKVQISMKGKSQSMNVLNTVGKERKFSVFSALTKASSRLSLGLLGMKSEKVKKIETKDVTSYDDIIDKKNVRATRTSIKRSNGAEVSSSQIETSPAHPNEETAVKEKRPSHKNSSKLYNMIDNSRFVDTLHNSSSEKSACTHSKCLGSIMFPPPKRPYGTIRPKHDVTKQAKEFLHLYYESINQLNSEAHTDRVTEVEATLKTNPTYHLTYDELVFGAKTAWRNAARCIGRIQWSNLKVFDCRHVTTAEEMFAALCEHIEYGTNNGIIRSAITVFPPRTDGRHDFRIWNSQLIKYAGYKQSDGSVIGDPISVEFTEICQKLGWKGKGGRFDILPLVLSAKGQAPQLFELPENLVLRVKLRHPEYSWFEEMGLEWFAMPAVSGMLFDCGGIEFTGTPFSGWYMSTEIGARDLCDPQRYNILPAVGEKMGLDTSNVSSLWKDKALVEINVAVLYSFQKDNVTITDHHAASESFMTFMNNEQRLRGGCPADWVWIVPPMSGSLLPVFHQEMLNYSLKPSYEYQQDPWRSEHWKHLGLKKKWTLKTIARLAQICIRLNGGKLRFALKCTILYATETGKSEKYAQRLMDVFRTGFTTTKVVCMDKYKASSLKDEELILFVTSTFGEGDPPENGQSFYKDLTTLVNNSRPSSSCSTPSTNRTDPDEINNNFPNIRYAVFALGSRAYPDFCAFGHTIDRLMLELGGTKIQEIGEGDELSGQEQSFTKWSQETFKAACDAFSVNADNVKQKSKGDLLPWTPDMFVLSQKSGQREPPIFHGLSTLHNRTISPGRLHHRSTLQAPSSKRQTVLVEIDSTLPYSPGDHIAIYPTNPTQMVLTILSRLSDAPPSDAVLKIESNKTKGDSWSHLEKFPPFTLKTAFSHYLDITTPPTPTLLKMFITLATNPKEIKRLEGLVSNVTLYEDWKKTFYPSIADVLEMFPSLKIPPTLLITQLPLLQQRFYSISSSPQAFPGEIHATVAVVKWQAKDGKNKVKHGVCSSWLNKCPLGTTIPCLVRRAPNFYMPEDKTLPIIMVGPGTGIAPFRSFWQQRNMDKEDTFFSQGEDKKQWGSMALYFGCRESGVDQIYKSEIEKAQEDGVITKYYTAFSRNKKQPKKYVQDILLENSRDVYSTIQCNGHIYVCGSVNMAVDVKAALEKIVEESIGVSAEAAKHFVRKLKENGYLHEDIFGASLGS